MYTVKVHGWPIKTLKNINKLEQIKMVKKEPMSVGEIHFSKYDLEGNH